MTYLTQARLIALVLCLALTLTFGCTTAEDAEPTATSSPFTPIFGSPTALAKAATTSQGHPPGTRTGIGIVDTVLDAVEGSPASQLGILIDYFPTACTDAEFGINIVRCPPGLPVGTTIDVVEVGGCEPGSLTEAQIAPELGRITERFTAGNAGQLFAVLDVRNTDFYPRATYQIVFVDGVSLYLSVEGITRLHNGACVDSGQEVVDGGLSVGGAELLLAPPN